MILLDTNVASELMRPSPTPAVASWVRARRPAELCATSITLAGIGCGIERLPEGRRKRLLRAIAGQVFSRFADQVLAFDTAAAADYGLIVRHRDRIGRPIDGFDAQIASITADLEAPLWQLGTSGTLRTRGLA